MSTQELTALLREARQWARDLEHLRQSQAVITRQGVLWVLGLSVVLMLAIAALSMAMSPGRSAGLAALSPKPLLLGSAAAAALLAVFWRARAVPSVALLGLLALFALLNLVGVWVNGLPALVFSPLLVMSMHLLLDHRKALAMSVLMVAAALVLLLWRHPESSTNALSRLVAVAVAVLVIMQLLARYWWQFTVATGRIGRDMAELVRDMDLELERTEAEAETLRRTDPDTGLLNRTGFEERARVWLSAGSAGAWLAVLRLGQWEASLAALPPSAQAALTERLAQIIRRALQDLPAQDVLAARAGVAEFWLLLRSPAGEDTLNSSPSSAPGPTASRGEGDAAWASLERLRGLLSPPITLSAATALTQPAIGCSRWPRDGDTLATLTARAQCALETTLEQRDAAVCLFEPAMEQRATEQALLTQTFGQAAGRGELELLFQPCARADAALAPRAQALLVWNHPSMGRLTSREFVPLRQTPLQVAQFMEWKLRHAAAQLARWRERLNPAFELSLKAPIGWVLAAADDAGPLRRLVGELAFAADALVLEVPEDALLRDAPAAARALRLMRQLGFRIAMDHFGAGLGGFGQLRHLPVSRLVIDSCLVEGMEAEARQRAVCAAVVRIGHAMGLEVVADGVELAAQREALVVAGCDGLQGPLVGPLMDAAQLEARWSGAALR